jgi:hypothetical protein
MLRLAANLFCAWKAVGSSLPLVAVPAHARAVPLLLEHRAGGEQRVLQQPIRQLADQA